MKKTILVAGAGLALCMSTALAAPPGTGHTPPAVNPALVNTNGYVAKTERGRLAQQVVRKWSGYVQEVYGTRPMDWSRAMGGTFAQADLANLRTAVKRKTFEALMGTLLGQGVTDTQIIDKLARGKGSKSDLKSLGSPANDLVYTVLAPCRIVDTRVAGGALSANVPRHFTGNGANFTAQGGSNTDCGIPAEPSAIVMNVTVVSPVNGPSHIRLYPYGGSIPNSSSINYAKGQIVANEVIVKQTIGQTFDFSVVSGYGTHLVIDVAGYFMAPAATALSCVSTFAERTNIAAGAGFNFAIPSCPSGYSMTGAGCLTPGGHAQADWTINGTYVPYAGAEASAFCSGISKAAGAITVQGGAQCCRVPGR